MRGSGMDPVGGEVGRPRQIASSFVLPELGKLVRPDARRARQPVLRLPDL